MRDTIIVLIIHPLWEIDEKAITLCICVCAIPIMAPNRADIKAIISIGAAEILLVIDKENSINNGANFCQKESIKHTSQLDEFITAGNHWWKGTVANFMKIPSMIKISGLKDLEATPPNRMNIDPTACGRKYLMGVSLWEFDMFSRGINEIILISKRIHMMIQLVEDRIDREEIIVKKINKEENIWGDHISVEKNLTFHKKVRSFFIFLKHYVHSREPWFHSWKRPTIKIITNMRDKTIG